MLIVGGLFSFKFQPLDSLINSSSIPFSIGYSVNQSLLINFRPYIYFNKDKYRLYGNIWVKNMPDNYFGVGYEENSNLELGSNTTSYKRNWWQLDFRFIRKVRENFFAGIVLDLNRTDASDLNPVMMEDPNINADGQDIRNSGLGINLEYDSRDVAVNAYNGLLLNVSATFYGEYLGTDYNYGIYIIDYRHYKTIKREGIVLAWQAKTRLGAGDVPWPEMSQLGTPFDLRGYRWGHYRDKNLVLGIVEYRHKFLRKNPDKNGSMLSKHGFVAWVATGSIAPTIGEFEHWLPNFGGGYRFEVQPRMNVRVDFGIGRKSNGVYVSFNEAF